MGQILVFVFFFFLPTQLAKHFWPSWSYIQGMRIDYLAPTISIIDIFALLIVIYHLNIFVQLLRTARRRNYVVLGLLIGINVVFSLLPVNSLLSWFHLLLNLATIIVIGKEMKKYLPAILAGLAVGSVIQLVLVTAQFMSQSSLQGVWYWLGERRVVLSLPDVAKISVYGREYLRPYGTFSHPNTLGGFYVLMYFFVYWCKQHIPTGRLVALANIVLIVCPFLVLMSFSRVAIFAFVIGNLMLVWSDFTYRKCLLCLVARTCMLVVVFLIFTIPIGDPYSLQKRLVLVASSLRIFVDHTLWGVGLGNYVVAQSSIEVLPRFAPLFQPVHNIFLLVLTEVGIGGIMLIFYFIRQLTITVALSFRFFPICTAVFITGFFDHYWVTQPQTQSLLIFVAITILFIYQKSHTINKEGPL